MERPHRWLPCPALSRPGVNIFAMRGVRLLFPVALSLAVPAATLAATEPGAKSRTTPSSASSRDGRAPGKGVLPDPVLLDGSGMPAEKRPEQGMLGEFELPGDENARSGRVGGAQTPPGEQGGGTSPPPENTAGGGSSSGQPQNPGTTPPPRNVAGGGPAGPNDPNAKAEGMQVGQLQGESGPGGPEGLASKPQAVSIGDSAMQIKTVQNAPGVVGAAVPAGQTQQMEKKVGGGRGSTSVQGGRNAAEKGRAMPSGL
jgi:hypothetical protein